MVVGVKNMKTPKVLVEELVSSGDSDDSSEEQGDDMIDVKEEISDSEDEFYSDNHSLKDEFEIKSEDEETDDFDIKRDTDDDIKAETDDTDIKEEDNEMSDDSDVQFDDNSDDESPESQSEDDENPDSPKKSKQKKEKHVTMDVELKDESDTGSESEDTEKEEDSDDAKTGLATVMAQILSTRDGSNVMLSKAKKDAEEVKKNPGDLVELVDAEGNVKKEVKTEIKEEIDEAERARKKLQEREALIKKLKLKPDFLIDREKERNLRIIATQGVVQLFSAIEKHKTEVRKQQSETKSIVAQAEMSSNEMKNSFLDILDREGEKLKNLQPMKRVKREADEELLNFPKEEKKPKWNVLAENFYKEPTLQGWDMKSDEDE